MWRIVKWLVVLIAVFGLMVIAYTFIGDFSAPSDKVTLPVEIDVK